MKQIYQMKKAAKRESYLCKFTFLTLHIMLLIIADFYHISEIERNRNTMNKFKSMPSVKRNWLTFLGAFGLLCIILICATLIRNPIGPNIKLIFTLIFAGVVLAAIAMIALLIRRAVQNKRINVVGTFFLSLALILVIVANLIISMFSSAINAFLTGSPTSSGAVAPYTIKSQELTERLEAEGLVLLKNEGNTLPLSTNSVNVFGYGSTNIVYGGAGSGAADESKNINLQTALANVGITANPALTQFYIDHWVEPLEFNIFDLFGNDYSLYEPSVTEFSDSLITEAKAFSDTALVVISRAGGEGGDLPMDMAAEGYSGAASGAHYLELAPNEQDMLAMVEANFEHVIVLINSSNAMELGFIDSEGVDAAIWIGGPGSTGLGAVARALTGEVNPSGRLADIYAYDVTSSPAYYNAGNFTYTNAGTDENEIHFVDYAEGIYVGYRYYETAAVDGYIDYDTAVQYPFGYGMSYTDFTQTMGDLKISDGNISVDVTVKNTGSAAGKEVVQLYYTAPYTKGGIEKSHVVLAAFEKTTILAPGASETVTLTFAIEDMASYDYKSARGYVLEQGDYEIKLMANSHDVIDARTYTVTADQFGRDSDQSQAANAFDYAASDVQYVSRADWAGTMPAARTTDREASAELLAHITDYSLTDDPDATPLVFKKNGLKLKDMVGLSYDDPEWELLLQQLSVNDMIALVKGGGYKTERIASISKPATIDIDGPAGMNGLLTGIMGVQFCSEVVIASTWNVELAWEMGKTVGEECDASGVSGLYGPACNIHRTPFAGRNFEYYSEDSLLSGKMAANVVQGASSVGVYAYVKHFALNDQEQNRSGLNTWSNEQAIREIYLRPFEIAVKEGNATAMMSAFNRIGYDWAGSNNSLLQTVLRDEWGFRGMVLTDMNMAPSDYMAISRGIESGNDISLSPLQLDSIDASNATTRMHLRTASHNILYTVANSNVFTLNHASGLPGWISLLVIVDVFLLGLITLGYIRCTKKKIPKAKLAK